MIRYVTITSQGQISIPAALRRQFQFDKNKKAIVEATPDGIMIKPIKDILDLYGVFKTNKRIPFRKVRKAFGEYMANRHAR